MGESSTPGRTLRRLLEGPEIVVAPGVFNPISAQMAARHGFSAAYVSGAALSAAACVPDIGLLTLNDVVSQVSAMTFASPLPLIVDADTGYGEVPNVIRAVRELSRAGAAGLHLEDQVFPKRCGHLDGKAVVAPEAMVQKIRAAVRARPDPDFLIIARCDARAVEGFERAVERSRLYLEAGADMIFPEALQSEAEFAEFARRVDGPLLANMTEWGKSPYLTATQFQALGYRMVIFPVTAFRVMLRAVDETYAHLKAQGTQVGLLERMRSRLELYEIIDYPGWEREDAAVAAEARELARRREVEE